MSLLDLKTDLKSLKYGKDRPGGGDSGQPYQKVDINTIDSGFNKLRMIKFDDGFIRGGAVGALNSAVVDTLRIGKFLVDLPKGPLFIAKQIGLQLSNPVIETKKLRTDNPTSGGGLLRNVGNFIVNTANKITNAIGPTRIYNLGINTIAQVPVGAFGVHLNRHGLLPVQDDDTKYLAVAEYNNYGDGKNNRLVGYKNKFKLGDQQINVTQNKSTLGLLNSILGALSSVTGIPSAPLNADPTQLTINKYISGPGSVYGIGNTVIQRYSFTEDGSKINFAKQQSKNIAGKSYLTLKPIEINTNANLYPISAKYTKSIFSVIPTNPKPGQFDGNLSDNTNLRTTLNDYVANLNDVHSKDQISTNKVASANKRITQTATLNFLGASKKPSSAFASSSFTKEDNNITDQPVGLDDIAKLKKYSGAQTWKPQNGTLGGFRLIQITSDLGKGENSISKYGDNIITGSADIRKGIDKTAAFYSNPSLKTYAELQKRIKYVTDGNRGGVDIKGQTYDVNKFNIYGDTKLKRNGNFSTYNPVSPALPVYYNGKNEIKINIPWNKINRENRVGSERRDIINLTPLFSTNAGTLGDIVKIAGYSVNINDLVKFRIQALNGDNPDQATWMVFRAYLTQFTDNTDATWNPVKYAGRGEDFYIYNGFSRKISIGFKVAALSEKEMKPMYQKLNYLMGNVMPDYKDNLMRGPIVRMTVGNWIDGQTGILNSVSYTVPQDSPWEIGVATNDGTEPLILPHVVEVSMTFTPIGSQTYKSNKISAKDHLTSHIAQNINDAQYITGSILKVQ